MTTLEKLEELIYQGFKETDLKFQETDRKFQEMAAQSAAQSKETDRKFKETDRKFQETDRKFQETDRKFKETDLKFKETDLKFKEMVAQSAALSKETDRKIQETDRELKETDRLQRETGKHLQETEKIVKALSKEVFGLTKSMGLFAEHTVKPAVPRLMAARGIEITELYSRASVRRNGGTMEVDVLGVGPQFVIAVEVKYRLRQEYVTDFLEELPRFFNFFPHYRDRTLYGAIAGMSIDQEVDRYAYKNGLFVLAQSGENVLLWNDEEFIPRAYNHPV